MPTNDVKSSQWRVLVPLLFGISSASLPMTLITTPAPQIATALGMTPVGRAWLVDIEPLTLAIALVAAARLGDRYGRRGVFIGGALLAVLGNLLGALSISAPIAIASRAVVGLACAALLASVVGTIGAQFRGRDLAVANGAWVATAGISNALGPVVGGLIAEHLGWRWVFAALVALAVLTLVSVVLMPNSSAEDRPGFDVASLILSAVIVGVGVWGVKQAGANPVLGGVLVVVGLALLPIFVRRQRRLPDPLIDVGLFGSRRFTVAAVQIFVTATVGGAAIYLVSVHLQVVENRSATEAGLALLPLALATLLSGVLAPRVLTRVRPGSLVRIAMVILALGSLVAAIQVLPVMVAMGLIGLGFGTVGTVATTTLFEAVPRRRVGQAGVIQETSFALGTGLGIALFSSLAAAGGDRGFMIAMLAAALLAAIPALLRSGDPAVDERRRTRGRASSDRRPSQHCHT